MSRPEFVQRQVQGVRQEMALLPRMLQSIEVLALPATELEAFLARAAEENEALVVEPPPHAPSPAAAGGGAEASDRHAAWLESQPAHDGGLVADVLAQVDLLELAPDELAWARLVARSLDASGYLSPQDEELLALADAEGLQGGARELGRAIATVQGLEPRGIGGRDMVEALLLQLDPADPDYALLCRLLEEFLDELARNKLPRVSRALGVEIERLQELLARLRELEPAPGQRDAAGAPPPIVPDVLVRRGAEGFEVSVEQSGLPSVRVDDDVRALAADRSLAPEARGRLRGKLERARWLVAALEERKRTLLRIARVVFERQRAFLEQGPGHLRPLRMGEVADVLGIHLSTVSRGVAGKHAETPWGTLPLRHFFQVEAGGGAAVTSDVRAQVGAIVAAEDAARPLSDDEIVAELARRGQQVARRTVAKYRGELGIPSSYRRRRYGA